MSLEQRAAAGSPVCRGRARLSDPLLLRPNDSGQRPGKEPVQLLRDPFVVAQRATATTRLGEGRLPRVSCVIPAFDERDNLQVLLPSLEAILAQQTSAWEVIVVDDGSRDGTADWMADLATRPGFRYLQLSRNFGKEAALSAGLAAADGEAVICLDADLQHPPGMIPRMLECWQGGADMVYAVRASRDQESRTKRWGARLLYWILAAGSRVTVPSDAGDFRLMDRAVVAALLSLPERTRFMKGLFAWVGFKTESLVYEPRQRLHGRSHFSLFRLLQFALDGITAFSTWPLRALTVSGFVVAVLAFGYGLYLVIEYLLIGNEVSGWTTIVTTMLFLSGVHLLGLGVIGAYLAQVFSEVKQRPLYILRQDAGKGMADIASDIDRR